MFKFKKPGIAILEVIIVLAISGFMFASVVGIFNSRRSSAVDDAARQVVSEIAKVRNEAQQNYLPSTSSNSEFYGKYLAIDNNSSQISVYSVFKNNSTGSLSAISERTINVSENLKTYLSSLTNDTCSSNIISCYKQSGVSSVYQKLTNSPVYVLYSSGNAQQYVFDNSTDVYDSSKYSSAYQRDLRLVIGVPGSGNDVNAQMANSKKKYYIYMPILSNPTLEVK